MTDDQIIQMLREDLKEVKKDVKALLGFKNRIMGVILTSSLVISFASNYLMKTLIP